MHPSAENSRAPTGTSNGASTPNSKPQRVLACLLCQQRKVKCDRKFPCANCARQQAECVPALVPRQRRRRFPERDLLDRVRHYEGLLRHHHISFDPLHPNAHGSPAASALSSVSALRHVSPSEDPRVADWQDDTHSEASRDRTGASSNSKAVDIWNAIQRKPHYVEDESNDSDSDDDDIGDAVIESAWDRTYHDENHDQFLFGAGSSKANVELSTLHPEQIQVVRLWQIYLENVNPLLRVTHTPTLQAHILNAVSDLAGISAELEALIFSIYCVSILSLAEDDCLRVFGSPKDHLLSGYQFACRQALLKCKVLRSDDRDCLTALFLYLVSVGNDTHPRSLSSMLAVAMHMAQRMGIHMERTYIKYSALEAEMCRRLWWSLVTFDHRICELSEYKTTTLTPTWDCKIPLNLHDTEIRPEMKMVPPVHEEPTEALFAVLRYQHANFIRHSAFHLNFVNPSLNAIAHPSNGDLAALEQVIEDKYITFCDSANPLHFITIWMARGFVARNRLLEHYSKFASSDIPQTEAQRAASSSYALSMLECDAKLLTSPLVKGYTWFVSFHFPMLAYVHVLRNLREQPWSDTSRKAWTVLSESYAAHAAKPKLADAIFVVCSRLVLQAWQARENSWQPHHESIELPRIVSDIRDKVAQMGSDAASPLSITTAQLGGAMGTSSLDQSPVPMAMNYSSQGVDLQGFPSSGDGVYQDLSTNGVSGLDVSQFWNSFDWKSLGLSDQ